MIRTFLLFLAFANVLAAVEFTTFLGGAAPLQVARVVADAAGNTYVAGTQDGAVFVAKLDVAGHTLLFHNISGHGPDTAADLAVDAAGNMYIGGATSSTTFPLHNAMQSTPAPGFLTKLSADGSQLIWSTYFREAITALAVDVNGNVYVTGSTYDPGFPVTSGLPAGMVSGLLNPGSVSGAFLTKIAAAGDRIVYSTVLAGQAKDCGCCSSCFLSTRVTGGLSVAVDTAGNAYLAGNSETHDLPATPGAFLKVGAGAFVAKVKADGSGLAYLTYLSYTEYPLTPSTNAANTAKAIACDAAGNAYLAGTTIDPKFPATAGAFQTAYAGPNYPGIGLLPPPDTFVAKLSPSGGSVVWGTYLGGKAAETANSIAIDASQQVWLAGTTSSPEFPNMQGWSQGSDFITGLDASGSNLIYSARYPNNGASRSVSVDPTGLLHVSGPTGIVSAISPGNPPLPRIFGVANAAGGPLDGRVAPGEVISIYGPHIGPAAPVIPVPDSSGNLPGTVNSYLIAVSLPNATPLPILYLADSQINAVVPIGSYASGLIHVVTPNGITPDFPLTEVPSLPAIFQNADGSAIAINQDGTRNGPDNPALVGSYVAIWTTGAGLPISGYGGHVTTGADNFYCCGVEFDFGMATVVYAGAAPGAVLGVSQVNFQVPATAPLSNPSGIRLVGRDGSLSAPVSLYARY